MYLHRHDAEDARAVWVFEQSSPEEWDAHFEHLRDLATWSGKTGKRATAILIARDFSRPDSKRRAELARLTEAPGYNPHVAFVSPSAALRTVLTMFGWVQKAPKYEMDFFGTSTSATQWLDKRRPGDSKKLHAMLADITTEYKTKTGKDLP
ncbi:hypothetical protein AKJ09_02213 [Labilithrix luteola]|uniref:STAS/SEC14 domain-containing protein n=1 Tax=Labilithrix luteola TaxID=1391654 RepID=A0A0K1PR05_9BACT|nr:hypothetical protein [Labilithrix luteola]AKU95549.1 hypothetical protein AKJ09_02213 [Labilithrix luteola]